MEQIVNKYHNGKIYTIRSHKTNLYYIGSTTQTLYKRIYKHRHHKKDYDNHKHHYISSFDILQYDDNYIELLEEYKCENKQELEKREGELIKLHKEHCVNIYIVGRTPEEKAQLKKQIDKQYSELHKEIINKRTKQHYIDNKDEITKRRSEKKMCICGIEYRLSHKARHEKTQRHINLINKTD